MLFTDKTIVECVPNFSEGRDPHIIQAIADAIRLVPRVHLLHQTSDPDHNRTVFTLAGQPADLQDALFNAIAVARECINLEHQRGQHPRMGATDVVPFVPIANCTMQDCIQLAHDLGRRVGDELDLPVYLYEHAATRPDRRNLADVRRGGYEHLKQVIHQPAYHPDYGRPRLTGAGAVIIGARDFLIAYNVFLDTHDVTIAQHIARAIRASDGGLAGVKALGLFVKGYAQVSMNIVDYHRAPLHLVMEHIREQARLHGVQILRSELIGLIPQSALISVATHYLQLDADTHDRLLENNLMQTLYSRPSHL